MPAWRVNRNDHQFVVNGISELLELAQSGRLGPGDLIQPPGASDWMYAGEIDALKGKFADGVSSPYDDDDIPQRRGIPAGPLALLFLLVIGVGGWFAYDNIQQLPDKNKRIMDQVNFSQVIVTGGSTNVFGEPPPGSDGTTMPPTTGSFPDGTVLDLRAKRGKLYKVRDVKTSQEGWIPVENVMPMYKLGGQETMEEYDPLYNPDRYLIVANASWMYLEEMSEEEHLSIFQFMLKNNSGYDMTDLVMVARIKDSKGQEIESVEFRVEGIVPAEGFTQVGTLVPLEDDRPKKDDEESAERRLVTEYTFQKRAEDDPELQLDYSAGAEVITSTEEITEASIHVIELRAIPAGEM